MCRVIAGIDQGGSETRVVIMSENGEVLALGKGPEGGYADIGMDAAMDAVRTAMDDALGKLSGEIGCFSRIAAGITGVDWPYETKLLTRSLGGLFPDIPITVFNDCIGAMRAGTDKQNSAVLCAGSGLNCAVRKGQDTYVYGFYIPDEDQGGGALSRMALRAVFDAEAGLIAPTALTAPILKRFNCENVDELLYQFVTRRLAAYHIGTPQILEDCAKDGDEAAGTIWINFGRKMSHYVTARMEIMDMTDEECDVVLSGSILKCAFAPFQEAIRFGILSKSPKANIVEARYEPVIGAGLLALDELYPKGIPSRVYENLRKSEKLFPVLRKNNKSNQ